MININIDNFFSTASILAIFFVMTLVIFTIILWVISSLGLMNLAKKNNIKNAWLSFVPIGYSYILGKLGYIIYPDKDKKNETLLWITFGLSIACIVISDKDLNDLLEIGLLVFHSIAYFNIFKKITNNYKAFTVFSILSNGLLGGVFLYSLRDKINDLKTEEIKDADVEKEEKTKENIKEENNIKEEEIKVKERPLYCGNCGHKLTKTAKFCSECGMKIE